MFAHGPKVGYLVRQAYHACVSGPELAHEDIAAPQGPHAHGTARLSEPLVSARVGGQEAALNEGENVASQKRGRLLKTAGTNSEKKVVHTNALVLAIYLHKDPSPQHIPNGQYIGMDDYWKWASASNILILLYTLLTRSLTADPKIHQPYPLGKRTSTVGAQSTRPRPKTQTVNPKVYGLGPRSGTLPRNK